VTLALFALGCEYDDTPVQTDSDPYPCGEPAASIIDKDAEVEADPGGGVGVVYEYLEGGTWRVTLACDTPQSGYACYWDVLAWPTSDGEIFDFDTTGFEGGDVVGHEYDGALHIMTTTGDDLDIVTFEATPGETLRFDALVGDAANGQYYCSNPYTFWTGEGALHTGSPSNVLDLAPSEP
jgi:hypothetical protein